MRTPVFPEGFRCKLQKSINQINKIVLWQQEKK